MDLEPMEPAKERRQRPGYYERHEHRKPWSRGEAVVTVLAIAVLAWVFWVFGPGPV